MAFRTDALPTNLCNNHKRTEPLNRSENVGVLCKAMEANSRISNKERYESLSS